MYRSSKQPARGGLALSLSKGCLAALGLAALVPTAARAQTQDLIVSNQDFGTRTNSVTRLTATGPGTFAARGTNIPSYGPVPQGLAYDTHGNLFVASFNNNGGTGLISVLKAGATPGTFDPAYFVATGLSSPVGLAFDARGNLFTAQYGNLGAGDGKITMYAPGATPGTLGAATTFASGLSNPMGLAFDAQGDLFAAISQGSGGSGSISKFAFNAVTGTFGASQTLTAPSLSNPDGLAFDARGDLFVSNRGANTLTEFALNPLTGALGAGTTFATGLNGPAGLAFDALGNLYAANSNTGSSISKFAFNPATGAFGSAQNITAINLSGPNFLAFGPLGPPAVPEASTTVSFGLLLALSLGGLVIAARRKKASSSL